MTSTSNEQSMIIRTERGLSPEGSEAIAGTRLTIYDVMDFLKAEYSPKLIRDKFNLTDEQITAALVYIQTNRAQVEAEYQQVLKTRAEIRQYWEERNRDRLAKIAAAPRKLEHAHLWAKLEEQKARRAASK